MIKYVFVRDKYSRYNKWTIEHETDYTYEIFYKGYITVLYKDRCNDKNGQLYSTEVRNINMEDTIYYNFDDEECYICDKILNRKHALVCKDSDNYICGKCAILHNIKFNKALE